VIMPLISLRIYKLVGLFLPSESSLGGLYSMFLVLRDAKHPLSELVELDADIVRYDFE
jgi:hypothetical protein